MIGKLRDFKHFDLIFHSASDMIFLIFVEEDGSFEYVIANQAATDTLNFPKDYAGRTIDEMMPASSAETIKNHYQQAIDKKEVVVYEERIELPSSDNLSIKKYVWVESRVTPIINDDGKCEHIIAITREITQQKRRERELKRLKEQFELIFTHVADTVFTFDENGDFRNINPSFTRLFGWTQDEIVKNDKISILPKDNDFREILNHLENGEVIENNYSQRITKNGELVQVLSSYTPVMVDGVMIGGIAVYKDITKVEQLKEKLQESEERYRLIVESSHDLISVTDKKGNITYASPSHLPILGLKPDFFIGKSFLSFIHQDDMPKLNYFIAKMIRTGEEQELDYRRLNKNGEIIWVESKGGPVFNKIGEVEEIIFSSRDITDRVNREMELEKKALYDELTGLPNRTLFQKELELAMKSSDRKNNLTAVLVLDCDNFKKVNDTLGHDIGDLVIREFGTRIQSNLRETDIVSRMGGDEFQVVIPDLQEKTEARTISQRIVESMKQPIDVGKESVSVTTSIGISYYDGEGKTQEVLLKEADVALYQSKNKGKNIYTEFAVKNNADEQQSIFQRLFRRSSGK